MSNAPANETAWNDLPWTEEAAPADLYTALPAVTLQDGTTLVSYEGSQGIWIERYRGEDADYARVNHGFWRDCELQEAAWFAREAWGC